MDFYAFGLLKRILSKYLLRSIYRFWKAVVKEWKGQRYFSFFDFTKVSIIKETKRCIREKNKDYLIQQFKIEKKSGMMFIKLV